MTRKYEETRLQIAVVDYLLGQIVHGKKRYPVSRPFPGLIFTHPANKASNEAEGYKFKRMGVRAGIPDLLFWWIDQDMVTHAGAVELKAASGSLSPEQAQIRSDFANAGVHYAVCRSVKEVRDILTSWGLECRNATVREPGLSFAEKSRLSMEFFAP